MIEVLPKTETHLKKKENNISVKIGSEKECLTFNAYDFSLTNFDTNATDGNLEKLVDVIYDGLNGDDKSFTFVEVDAFVRLGGGQHIFPSQEMNMRQKEKVLFRLPVDGKDCAAIHNVKNGNAIRTIDYWYNDAKFPIAIEPYGSVTQMGQAYRKTANEGDLYSLMMGWLNGNDVTGEQKSFVVGNLIRGGVFGGKGE